LWGFWIFDLCKRFFPTRLGPGAAFFAPLGTSPFFKSGSFFRSPFVFCFVGVLSQPSPLAGLFSYNHHFPSPWRASNPLTKDLFFPSTVGAFNSDDFCFNPRLFLSWKLQFFPPALGPGSPADESFCDFPMRFLARPFLPHVNERLHLLFFLPKRWLFSLVFWCVMSADPFRFLVVLSGWFAPVQGLLVLLKGGCFCFFDIFFLFFLPFPPECLYFSTERGTTTFSRTRGQPRMTSFPLWSSSPPPPLPLTARRLARVSCLLELSRGPFPFFFRNCS